MIPPLHALLHYADVDSRIERRIENHLGERGFVPYRQRRVSGPARLQQLQRSQLIFVAEALRMAVLLWRRPAGLARSSRTSALRSSVRSRRHVVVRRVSLPIRCAPRRLRSAVDPLNSSAVSSAPAGSWQGKAAGIAEAVDAPRDVWAAAMRSPADRDAPVFLAVPQGASYQSSIRSPALYQERSTASRDVCSKSFSNTPWDRLRAMMPRVPRARKQAGESGRRRSVPATETGARCSLRTIDYPTRGQSPSP